MKRSAWILTIVALLIALLALPAAAQGPVPATWTQPSFGFTAPPTFTPLGADRCLLKLSWMIKHAGDMQGDLIAETWSFMDVPCFDENGNPPAPGSVPETWVSTGSFTGMVKGKSGTADFIEYRQIWPAAAGEVYWRATGINNLDATGELSNMSLVSDYQVRQGDVPVLGGWVDFTPGAFRDLKMSLYGTYNSIPFFKYTGTFHGVAAGGPYSAPFELVLPGHPALGNGRLVFEPIHPTGGVHGRNDFLTPEFLFNRGFSSAAVCYGQPLPIPDIVPNHPCQSFSGAAADGDQIMVDFVHALRSDPAISVLVGGPTQIYAFGIAHTAEPMDRILHSEAGQGLFDFTELVSLWWFGAGAHTLPPTDAGRVLVLQTEADVLNLNAAAAHGSGPMYRSYDIAGAPGVPDDPLLYPAFPGPPRGSFPPLAGTSPLNWAPTVRALFLAGDRWVVENTEPPASVTLQGDSTAADGLARDQNGNALGGIRYPDLELGRGYFNAVGFAVPVEGVPKGFPLYGAFTDLACTSLPDGSARFWDHAVYVQRFTDQANKLVSDGYLLREDADRMIAAAKASNVGRVEACSGAAPKTFVTLPAELQGQIDGAPYRIRVPKDWNGTLVVFAHGYIRDDPPQAALWGQTTEDMLLAKGYAVAASAYKNAGWAVEEGIADTRLLVDYFQKNVGVPHYVILNGMSMGSVITFKSIELYPDVYDGAVSMCFVGIGNAGQSWDRFLDFALAYDAAFGWPADWGTAENVRSDLSFGEVAPVVFAQLADPAHRGRWEFVRLIFGAPSQDFYLLPPQLGGWVDMMLATEARAELGHRFGGQPLQNMDRVYALTEKEKAYLTSLGVDANALLDQMNTHKVQANTDARNHLGQYSSFSGNITRPMLTMHGQADSCVPASINSPAYRQIVAANGKEDLLLQVYTNGIGHCAYTSEQVLATIQAMDSWLRTSKKPDMSAFPTSIGFNPGYDPAASLSLPVAAPEPQTLPETGQRSSAQAVWLPVLLGTALICGGVLVQHRARLRR